MTKSVFQINEMDCPTEEQMIRNRLERVSGIVELQFNLVSGQLTVIHTLTDPREIAREIDALGFNAHMLNPESMSPTESFTPYPYDRKFWLEYWPLAVSGLLALGAEGLELFRNDTPKAVIIVMPLAAIALACPPLLKKAFTSIRTLTFNIYFLMTVAIVGAVVIGKWPEAAVVAFLFAVAEVIEAKSLEHAKNAISRLIEVAPRFATVLQADGSWLQVEVSQTHKGQRVRVKPGERIPLDGVVVEGASAVNQAPITGESIPVDKTAGDTVFAGTINLQGSLDFVVSSASGETTLDHIAKSVQNALSRRAPIQRFVDRFASYYTPAVVILAVFIASVPPLFMGASFQEWFYRALVLLVIACPCALVISTPITLVSGLAAAARRGILVKGGGHLEIGYRLKAIALDKTGTLTRGLPQVTDFIVLNGQQQHELMRIVASINNHSEHPLAAAMVRHWYGHFHTHPDGTYHCNCDESSGHELWPVESFESVPGRGTVARVRETTYYIGSPGFIQNTTFLDDRLGSLVADLENQGKTAIALAGDGAALAVIALRDTLRPESAQAVKDLESLGVHTILLTGDNSRAAQAVAREIGIKDVRAELLPEDKLNAVGELIDNYGSVGMVGDGVNDAPALAKASLGFAMASAGSDTAMETADVALMKDDLSRLPEFVQLCRRTRSILVQNLTLSIGIKAVYLGLALAGKATLWMAVFADMGASLLVIFNGLRLLRWPGRK